MRVLETVRLVALLGLVASVLGCSSKDDQRRVEEVRPCDPPAVEVDGLRASLPEQPPLVFHTDGTGVWIEVTFQKTWGFFDPTVSAVHKGTSTNSRPMTTVPVRCRTPCWRPARNRVWQRSSPCPGSYWLWATNGPDIVLSGCTPEAVEVAQPG